MYLFTPSVLKDSGWSVNKQDENATKDRRLHSMTGSSWMSPGKHSIGSTICCPTYYHQEKGKSICSYWKQCLWREFWLLINRDKNAVSWGHWFSLPVCGTPGPYSQVCSGSINQGESSPQAAELDCAAVICSPGVVMEVAKCLRNILKSLQPCTSTWCSLAWFLATGALSFALKGSLTIKNWPNGRVSLIFIIGCSKGRANSRDFPTQNF